MLNRFTAGALMLSTALLGTVAPLQADDPIFSGPQPSEKLAPLPVKQLGGKDAGQDFNLAERIGDEPAVVIFVHTRTRPGLGLANTVMRFAASRKDDNLVGAYVFLTDDVTEIENWTRRINPSFFPDGILRTVSPDGIEGPGAYGLNRNVTLTVLVAKSGRVTANFALVQPSEQADGPRVFKAIVDALGGGDVPDIARFSNRRYASDQRRAPLPRELQEVVRPLLQSETSEEMVQEIAAKVAKFLEATPAAKQPFAQAVQRLANDRSLLAKSSPSAQKQIREWARTYQPASNPEVNLRELLAPLIRKNATREDVDAAAKKIEAAVKARPAVRREIARVSRTIVDSGRLENYGTPAAQEYLKTWARELNQPPQR